MASLYVFGLYTILFVLAIDITFFARMLSVNILAPVPGLFLTSTSLPITILTNSGFWLLPISSTNGFFTNVVRVFRDWLQGFGLPVCTFCFDNK